MSIEQIEGDIASAREALANALTGIDKMRKELKSLTDKVANSEVRDTSRADPWYKLLKLIQQAEHGEAERRLQEERDTLTRFDTELSKLDEVIKAKKQAASDADVAIKKLDHEIQALAKEKADHVTAERTSRSSMSGSRRKASR